MTTSDLAAVMLARQRIDIDTSDYMAESRLVSDEILIRAAEDARRTRLAPPHDITSPASAAIAEADECAARYTGLDLAVAAITGAAIALGTLLVAVLGLIVGGVL